MALECKLNERGQLRVRFERGWTSTTTLGGMVLLEPVPTEADSETARQRDREAAGPPGLNSGFVAAADMGKDASAQSVLRRAGRSEESPEATQETSPGRVVYTIEEEDDQVPIQPMLYMAAKKAVVRAASRLDSPRIGLMSRGELILVTHTKVVGVTLRLRFGRGWTSAIGGDGRTIFIAENNPNRHYRAVKLGRVTAEFDENSETIGTITKNSVIEGVETREILPRGDKPRYRIRLRSGGWATEVAKNGVRLLTLVTFQRPDGPARPISLTLGGTGFPGFDSPRKMIKRIGISSGVTITFGKGPLGVGLAENLDWMSASAVGAFATVVERFNLLADGSKGPVEASGRVHIGDLLVAVSGTDVRSEEHTTVLSRIRACPRPFTITFCEPRLLAGLVLEVAPPRVRRLSGGMLREQSLPRVRSLSLRETERDSTVPGDYSTLAQHASSEHRRKGGQQPSHRGRRRHRSDPRNSRVSAADRVLTDAGEDDPDDDRVVERRSSAASFGSAALMPIEDLEMYELEEPLSGRSDRTYQSSTSNMFDPTTMGEDGLVIRPGVWAGKPPDHIAGRIDQSYDSQSDLGDGGGGFGQQHDYSDAGGESVGGGEKGWSDLDDTATGSDGGTSSVGGSLRSFAGGAPGGPSDLDRGLLSDNGGLGVTTTPNPLAGLQGGLLHSPRAVVPRQRVVSWNGATTKGGGGANFRERDIMDTDEVEGGAAGVMMIDAAEVLHKTGMLSKRGGIRKTWKARYFVLSKTTLRYYEKPGDSLSLGALSLSNAIVEEVPFHEMGKLYCFCARTQHQGELYMHANTKQSMEEWIDVFTAAAAMRADDRLANELIGHHPRGGHANGNALDSLSAKAKHQAGQLAQSVGSSVENAVTIASGKVDSLFSRLLSCIGRDAEEELWAAPFNANAAANSGGVSAPHSAAATHNPMQLLPAAHRGPMGAGQPIPRTVHNRNPFLQGGPENQMIPVSGSAYRSVVNPLRPLQRSDAGGAGAQRGTQSSSRITHNPMRQTSGGAGGLMRQGYVLPDVSEDMDEDLREDMDGIDREDTV